LEVDLIWEPSKNWSVLASYAHTDTKVLSDNDPLKINDRLTRVPRDSGRIAVRYRFTQGTLSGLGIGLGMTAASGAETTLPNTLATRGYAVFDAQASYSIGPVRLGVSVNNITGKTYFLPYRYLDQAVVRPGAPRSAFVTLGVGF
jgi:iron complex outermembrane receptor protein